MWGKVGVCRECLWSQDTDNSTNHNANHNEKDQECPSRFFSPLDLSISHDPDQLLALILRLRWLKVGRGLEWQEQDECSKYPERWED